MMPLPYPIKSTKPRRRFAPLIAEFDDTWVMLRGFQRYVERTHTECDSGSLEPRGYGWTLAKAAK